MFILKLVSPREFIWVLICLPLLAFKLSEVPIGIRCLWFFREVFD